MADIAWTPALVEARLEEAHGTLRCLPEERVRAARSSWPPYLHDFRDVYGQEPAPLRLGPPSAVAITRMDEALDWLRRLDPDDAKLVWARAEGMPWKGIAWRFGLTVRTAQRRHQHAVHALVWRLLGRPLPATWSRRFLKERIVFLSDGARP